ncbi:MAG: cysteine--tRNA ligase, partial [Desulfobulbaceae bacterium]|nr:cysteine--tRNA ligase [Desulfobulbaceae bacterium]
QALTKLLQPLVENLLSTRQHLRENGQFEAGDALRDALTAAGITVVDTNEGYRWQLSLKKKIF